MNERIKELADQAGFVLWKNESWNSGDVVDWSASYDDELEKFAELICWECFLIGAKYIQSNDDVSKFERHLKKHFGVE